MATREPEWDDLQRGLMLGLEQYEAELCRCGTHPDIEARDDVEANFGTRVCTVCAGRDRHERRLQAKDDEHRKGLGDKPNPDLPDPADGRHVTIRLRAVQS